MTRNEIKMTRSALGILLLITLLDIAHGFRYDKRDGIIDGTFKPSCLHYDSQENIFRQTCDINWSEEDYMTLGAKETFDGGGHLITMMNEWPYFFVGLFEIKPEVKSRDDAPLITNTHTRGGMTSRGSGFIVQKRQQYFKVSFCSSTGLIRGPLDDPDDPTEPKPRGGGGICGKHCGVGGFFNISNSYSTGEIEERCGGIAGERAGNEGGDVYVHQCYSTGPVSGRTSGGIYGRLAGAYNGKANVHQSHSSGAIYGTGAGGIVGSFAATSGRVTISQCYSTGNIGLYCGGLCGNAAGGEAGHCVISDSYTTGNMTWGLGGGLVGAGPGDSRGIVEITNSYSRGISLEKSTGGIVAKLSTGNEAPKLVSVRFSVFNDRGNISLTPEMAAPGLTSIGNSGNINDIRGKLYSFDGKRRWSDKTWAVLSEDAFPLLRFQDAVNVSAITIPKQNALYPERAMQIPKRTIKIRKRMKF